MMYPSQGRCAYLKPVYAAVALLCCSALSRADDLAYLELSLEQLLDVPVTGSTLTAETLKTVPAAVSVFTREHIDRLGVDYLYEVLNLVPGFQFDRNASSGMAYTYSARGRRTTQQSLEVLLLIDGKVVNDPRAGSPDITLPLYPVARIERLEVIRGPGSALYGSSAFTGVINIVTRKQQKSLALAYGSQQRRQLEGMWSQQLGSWDSDVFVHAEKDRGEQYTLPDTFNGELIDTSDPREQLTADLSLRRGDTRLDFSYNRAATKDFYQSENTANGFNANEREWWHASLDQSFNWLPDTRSQLVLSYQHFSYDFDLYLTGPGQLQRVSNPPSADPFWGEAGLAGESWRATFANDWTIDNQSSAQSSIQWGLQWAHHEETQASALGNFDLPQLIQRQIPITYYGEEGKVFPIGTEESQGNAGAYLQYLRNLRASTRLTLGGRYDQYDDMAGRFSPRLGLVEQISDSYSLKLLYGEAFRAPTLAETGLLNNPVLVGNPDLDYEVVKTWDLILMGNWHATNLSLGLFQNHYEQPIEIVFVGRGRTYQNGEEEESEGLEVEWTQDLSNHWSLRSTYTYMDLPDSAFREATELASFEINYAAEKWNWNLLGYYQDERQTPVTPTSTQALEDFWMLNTQWRYRFEADYEVGVQLKNITDEEAATPAESLGKLAGIPNRGRELSVDITWHF
ncbi:MAG TPA: TonB-dependent receptor [Cellvibrio sp.]|nr:TonB-dependent receptor [Cellvibrio sp.]